MGLAPHNVQKHLGFCMGHDTPCGHMELLDVAHTAFFFSIGTL